MAKIGAEANVSGALVSHYFENKEELLVQANRALLDDVYRAASRSALRFRSDPGKNR